ncbi:MAG: hypothetical protein KDA27_27195 [Candidatus Eisenbacteria bacterium]|uniref:Uncharacterized protein n=1 Tax=Eiseniibacteriota bacterium TaxID=2212470 RepID=A0A956NJ31_UNCEI|nr:hypothetical protein [Candidatus Eisenbacteria bacterium]
MADTRIAPRCAKLLTTTLQISNSPRQVRFHFESEDTRNEWNFEPNPDDLLVLDSSSRLRAADDESGDQIPPLPVIRRDPYLTLVGNPGDDQVVFESSKKRFGEYA